VTDFLLRLTQSYVLSAFFIWALLILEITFPRGSILPLRQRLRAILFIAIYIPFGVLFSRLAGGLAFKPLVVSAILAPLTVDFFYYWYHRAQHSIPWLWRFHAVHHSVEELGAGTGYHHISEAPLKALLVAVPASLLAGRDGGLITILIFGFHGYYIHSTTRINLGIFAWLVADNRTHRIHHSMELRHYDRNFGAFTMLWDKLFGTAYFPKKGEWPRVGLAHQAEPKTITEYLMLPAEWRNKTLLRRS
jgi:sterol desaturase/sphingolipid hydroxylase (fatty acid hydroxylase superfamily)